MAKPGFLSVLAPILGIGAGLLAPELLGPLIGAEAAAGGGAAAGLADTVGGIGPEAFLAAPFTEAGTAISLGATPLAGEALSAIPDVTGLANTAAGAAGPLASAAGQLAGGGFAPTAGPGLLSAEAPAAATPAATTPLATTPLAAPGADLGVTAATPASPVAAGSFAPAEIPASVNPISDIGATLGPGAGTSPVNANLLSQTLEPFQGGGTLTPPAGAAGAPASTITPITPDLTAAAPGASPVAGGTDVTNAATWGLGDQDFSGGAEGGIGGALGSAGSWVAAHPGALLTGLEFGSQLFKGNPPYPAEANIGNLAASQQGTSTALTTPIQTGILPPGAQQEIDASTNAAIAQTRSTYGNLGLAGSTMEADKISQIKQDASAKQFAVADHLLQQGAQFSGLAGQDYATVLRSQMARDKQYQDSLYNFARALAGSGYSAPNYAAANA